METCSTGPVPYNNAPVWRALNPHLRFPLLLPEAGNNGGVPDRRKIKTPEPGETGAKQLLTRGSTNVTGQATHQKLPEGGKARAHSARSANLRAQNLQAS